MDDVGGWLTHRSLAASAVAQWTRGHHNDVAVPFLVTLHQKRLLQFLLVAERLSATTPR